MQLTSAKYFAVGYVFGVATFGENVRRLRKQAGLRANKLAEILNVTPPVVSAWERDRGGLPETPTLLKMAKAFDCSIDELLVGIDPAYDAIVRRRATAPIVTPETPTLSTPQRDLIADLSVLSDDEREAFHLLIRQRARQVRASA